MPDNNEMAKKSWILFYQNLVHACAHTVVTLGSNFFNYITDIVNLNIYSQISKC